jgi:hypothetical protein
MSSTQSGTIYQISAFPGNQQGGGNIEINVNASDAFGDSDAFAMIAALVAAFPESWNMAALISLTKLESSSTEWIGNTASTPPAFQ